MINKFELWFNRALEFARGDSRDYNAFLSINKNYLNNIYKNMIENKEIENDDFIKHITYLITSGSKGIKYILPDLIFKINIINLDEENNLMYFNLIYNISGDIFKIDDNIYKFELNNHNLLYNYVFNIIKHNIDSLYKIYQLKILYNDLILNPNTKLNYFFLNSIL